MATPRDYINAAARYIGIGGTDNIFNTWVWGFNCYDPYTYPWCAAFQSYVGIVDCGLHFSASASAAGVANQGRRIDDSEVQPGDWVVFNWDGRDDTGWCDHIGLVEWFDHGTDWFGTIEGNCDDQVMRCTRDNNGPYFTAFFRPPYDSSVPEPPKPAEPPKGWDVCMWPSHGGDNQRWKIENRGNGLVSIQNKADRRYLDVQDARDEDAAKVILWSEFHGGPNQLWRLDGDNRGYFRIVSAMPRGLVLDVVGANPEAGAGLCVFPWKEADSANQEWAILDNYDGTHTIMNNGFATKMVLDCVGGGR